MRLERAFRRSSVVLLKGMGGVGKTELAVGFARWLQETQGCTGGVFFTSFEKGQGLSAVVNAIGRRMGGARFAPLMPEHQEALVLNYLQTTPCLLIWDNFEPVAGFPSENEPRLNETERRRLTVFLKALRQGNSWVLITSRRTEPWLDCGYELVELRGLSKLDAAELAAQILQMAGVERSRLSGEYLKLLSLLGGHPLSLRVVLPHLKTQTPENLIEALRLGLDTFAGAEEEGRETSLTVSLDYSFKCLSARTRQHLPFLALFAERVSTFWLGAFAGDPESEYGQAYQAVFGETVSQADWQVLLQEATAAGILDHLDATYYQIHPALPWYLRQRLEALMPKGSTVLTVLEAQLLNFYAVLANHYRQQLVSKAEQASGILQAEEPNLLQQLRLAEQQQQWSAAQFILQALGEVYERRGRKPEWNALQQRVLKQIGLHLSEAKAKGKAAFDLWVYIRVNDANDALQAADLEGARIIYQEILDELLALNTSEVASTIAVAYHNLGMVAQEQRRYEEAIAFYQKALKIYEDAGDSYNAASEYHQLGRVAEEQRRFDEAIAFYQKALKIFEDAGDGYNAADEYHQLGRVAQEQRRFDEAIAFYQKALKIFEDAGDGYNAADEYHQLGRVAQEQRRFDEAIAFYQKALKIYEDAGDFYNAADEYHQLGRVAEEQRRYDEAIAYYQKALKIYEDAGDFYSAARDYHQLGRVAQEQRRFEEAIAFYQKALKIFEDVGDLYLAASDYHHLGRVAEEQRRFDEAIAFYQKALKIFEDAGDFYSAAGEYHQLGNIAYLQRRFDEAIAFYEKALKIYEDAGDFYSAAGEYHQLGRVAEEQRRFDEAIAFYQKALKIREDVGDLYLAASDYHQLGIVAQYQRRFDEAIAFYQKALKIYEDAGDGYNAADEYHQFGRIAHEQERLDDAMRFYIKALMLYLEARDEHRAGLPIHQLARLLAEIGETEFKAIWQTTTGEACPDNWLQHFQSLNDQPESEA